MKAAGLEYSGQYGFAPTDMFWKVNHKVVSKAQALKCNDCHSANGRLDWKALGYPGDPRLRSVEEARGRIGSEPGELQQAVKRRILLEAIMYTVGWTIKVNEGTNKQDILRGLEASADDYKGVAGLIRTISA